MTKPSNTPSTHRYIPPRPHSQVKTDSVDVAYTPIVICLSPHSTPPRTARGGGSGFWSPLLPLTCWVSTSSTASSTLTWRALACGVASRVLEESKTTSGTTWPRHTWRTGSRWSYGHTHINDNCTSHARMRNTYRFLVRKVIKDNFISIDLLYGYFCHTDISRFETSLLGINSCALSQQRS